jgi:hypothetical protein
MSLQMQEFYLPTNVSIASFCLPTNVISYCMVFRHAWVLGFINFLY